MELKMFGRVIWPWKHRSEPAPPALEVIPFPVTIPTFPDDHGFTCQRCHRQVSTWRRYGDGRHYCIPCAEEVHP